MEEGGPMNRYGLVWYTNGMVKYTMSGLSANAAYTNAMPANELYVDGGSRWHILSKKDALGRISSLLPLQRCLVCWHSGGMDHISVVREG